jgi:hypothetical protein
MTTNCVSMRRLLSEALDDALSRERQQVVEQHLANCHGCRQRHAQMQKLQASLQGLPTVAPPAALEKHIRQIWHPLMRSRPAVHLYPYLPAIPVWGNVRQLRLAGHLAGFFLTAIGMALILSFLGRFSLDYEHLAEPGVYSLMNRPSMYHGPATSIADRLVYPEDTESYANTNILAESARLNGYVLTRFADDEKGALHEDSLSVVTQVQPDGRGAIEGVLHTPRDRMLFVRFSQLLSTSQFDLSLTVPQSNGRIIWSFRRIIVIS